MGPWRVPKDCTKPAKSVCLLSVLLFFEINTCILSDMEKATKYGPDANLEKRDLPSSMRDPVQARKKKLDMESGVGKTVPI